MKLLAPGLASVAVVTLILWLIWGAPALVPGVVFGGLATGIQVVALELLAPAAGAPFATFMRRWAIGMGLRLAGVGLFAAAVLIDRDLFPPMPAAFAYLGVLLPLLFMELRWLK